MNAIPVLYIPLPTDEIRVVHRYALAALARSACTLFGRVLLAGVIVVGLLGYLAICLGDAIDEVGS